MYCKCGNEVHPVRLELGYKTCVEHSTTQTYSYVPIIEHKNRQYNTNRQSRSKCIRAQSLAA